jgi:hypothetical protein
MHCKHHNQCFKFCTIIIFLSTQFSSLDEYTISWSSFLVRSWTFIIHIINNETCVKMKFYLQVQGIKIGASM